MCVCLCKSKHGTFPLLVCSIRLMADKDELARKCAQLAEMVRVSRRLKEVGQHFHLLRPQGGGRILAFHRGSFLFHPPPTIPPHSHTSPLPHITPPTQCSEDKHDAALSKMKEGWAAELKRQREGWAAGEKAKREAWMEAKTREVKEVTVKGLEQEVWNAISVGNRVFTVQVIA